jgi:hypothetical protein
MAVPHGTDKPWILNISGILCFAFLSIWRSSPFGSGDAVSSWAGAPTQFVCVSLTVHEHPFFLIGVLVMATEKEEKKIIVTFTLKKPRVTFTMRGKK